MKTIFDASPDLYPLVLDLPGDRIGAVRLDEAAYRAASFLDERLLAGVGPPVWIPWDEVEAAATLLTGSADFIFHIGHVGSTLLSRLLGNSARVFSVREPAVLRALATLETQLGGSESPWTREMFERRLDELMRLWARVYRRPQRSLVKATSHVGEMASLLMRRSPSARAILMFVSPQVYIASILGGPATRAEAPAAAGPRLARLRRRLGDGFGEVADFSEGELAAMSWACELLGLARAARDFGDRVLWLDFEAFLADPAAGLTAALTHLHGAARGHEVAAMLAGPDLRHYSKAPEYPYDAALRRRIVAQAGAEHGREIERGLNWLNAAGADHVAIADAARMAAAAPRFG